MSNYSTVTRVRTEAGFDGNDNITDTYMQTFLDQATQVVNGYVYFRYVPSTFHVNFSGSQAQTALQRCEELLAAGYLMNKEYPAEQGHAAAGKAKVDQAQSMLQMIKDGDVLLLDSNEAIYGQQSRNPSAGSAVLNMPEYDQTPAVAPPSDRKFGVDDIY